MFCTKCGSEIDNKAIICPQCGAQVEGSDALMQNNTPTVSNYMVGSIISLLFCWVLGIPAIIFASRVNARLKVGDIEGAQKAAKTAKTLMTIGLVCGIFALIYNLVVGINR